MIYLMRDITYSYKNIIQQMKFVKHCLKRNLKLLAGSRQFAQKKQLAGRSLPLVGRVNSRKEVTMGEVPNTWNDKEVCEVISAV